jgi:hypothetical protein
MNNNQLFDYIKRQLEAGRGKEEIKKDLLEAGWQEADVNQAFSDIFDVPQPPEPPSSSLSFDSIETLPDFGTLFKRTFLVFKEAFAMLWFTWFIIVLLIIPFVWLSVETIERLGLEIEPVLLLSGWITIMVFLINLSLLIGVVRIFEKGEDKVNISDIIFETVAKFFPFVWLTILSSLVVSGGLLLGIIPGIIFYIHFIFAPFVLIAENIGGLNALFRSKQLISGLWKEVFIRLLPIYLLLGSIAFLPYLFMGMGSDLLVSFGSTFVLVYSFILYNDLKYLKREVPFDPPSRKTKKRYILIIILGLLLISFFLAREKIYPYLPGYVPRARSPIEDMVIRSNMHLIRVSMEGIYLAEGVYTHADCVHPELAPSCSIFKERFGKEPIIYTSSDNYCAYIDMKLSTGEYYCIDNLGARAVVAFPGQVFYCDGTTFGCP